MNSLGHLLLTEMANRSPGMIPEDLDYAGTSLASVLRNGPVIELAGRPWTRDERLAERLGAADQLAWRAAALVLGRIVTVAG